MLVYDIVPNILMLHYDFSNKWSLVSECDNTAGERDWCRQHCSLLVVVRKLTLIYVQLFSIYNSYSETLIVIIKDTRNSFWTKNE